MRIAERQVLYLFIPLDIIVLQGGQNVFILLYLLLQQQNTPLFLHSLTLVDRQEVEQEQNDKQYSTHQPPFIALLVYGKQFLFVGKFLIVVFHLDFFQFHRLRMLMYTVSI